MSLKMYVHWQRIMWYGSIKAAVVVYIIERPLYYVSSLCNGVLYALCSIAIKNSLLMVQKDLIFRIVCYC